jgi:hypothetical protein
VPCVYKTVLLLTKKLDKRRIRAEIDI